MKEPSRTPVNFVPLQFPLSATASWEPRQLRPPLKWAGGKRWQVPHLRPFWEQESRRRLVEPFCGALAVTIALKPARALLNDINGHVINFYRWLKRGLFISLPMTKSRTRYYEYRQRFNALLASGRGDSEEAASLFYYLNRTGYNGLCRFNRSGEFNVPFGQYRKITYWRDFSDYRLAFASWEFTNVNFDEMLLEPDDFVYADPPYDVQFTQYAKQGFGWKEQVRTAEWLAGHSGPVILANQATPRVVELYGDLGYRLKFFQAPRRISCTGDRSPVEEVLALRNLSDVP